MTPEYGWDDFIVRDGRSRIGTPRWGDASDEARAATPSGLSRFASSCQHRIAIAWKRWTRSPYTPDLRIIQIEHRHLYRQRLASGDLGWALNALYEAYLRGHLIERKRK
jgi:hypothetical protein